MILLVYIFDLDPIKILISHNVCENSMGFTYIDLSQPDFQRITLLLE